jgi:hypothetical protein
MDIDDFERQYADELEFMNGIIKIFYYILWE